ncbi:hypothetical protein BGX38DRAFT_1277875 [Terfezia claveryi]|nr:hypothetical protein BGX38DRAFT_1277875 [Terfezia claveryi]
MASPSAKRKVSQPAVRPQTRSKHSKTDDTLPAPVPVHLGLIDPDGYINDDSILEAFMPAEMTKWLPKPLVDMLVSSVSLEEWRAKAGWLIAMVWYKVHNFSDSFLEEMLQTIRPARDGVIDVTSEKHTLLDYQNQLQNGFFEVLLKLARYWTNGTIGKEYTRTLRSERGRKLRLSKLKVTDVESWLELGHKDYYAIWYPVTFVTDALLWLTPGNFGRSTDSAARGSYQELRLSTLAMLVRVITVLSTDKVNQQAISNAPELESLTQQRHGILVSGLPHQNCEEYHAMIKKIEEKVEKERKVRSSGGNKLKDDGGDVQQVRGNADKEEDGSGKESEVVEGNPDKPEKQNIETIQVADGDGSDGGQKESAKTVDLTREDGENVVALEGQQDKNFFEFMKGEEQQFLEGGLEHIPVMPMDLGNEFSVETAGAFGEEKMTKSGLVTLAQFAEIERENKEDWVLDNRIAELLRPSLSEAIRIALMGPMGVHVDKKIERYKHVVTELQLSTDEAIQSVERLNLLRQELNNKIEEAHKERKKFADTKEWAAQQKNAKTSTARTLPGGGGRLARLGSATIGLTVNETPRRQRDFQRKESVEVSPNFSFKHEIKPEKTVIKREKTVDADALIKAQEEGRRDKRTMWMTTNMEEAAEMVTIKDQSVEGENQSVEGKNIEMADKEAVTIEVNAGKVALDTMMIIPTDIIIGVIMVPLDVETSVKEIMIGEGVGKTKREGIEPRERKIGSGQEVEALCLRGNGTGGGTKNYVMIVIDLGGDKGEVNSTTSPVMEDQGEVDQGEVGASTVTIPGGDKEQVNSTKSPVIEDKGVGWACCGGRKMLSMNEEVDNDDDLMPE